MATRLSPATKFRQAARDKGAPEKCDTGEVIPLDLPHGAVIRSIGLQLPDELSLDSWAEIGIKLATCGNGIQFALGDWWAFGHHKYGDRKALAEAKKLPFCFGTMRNYGSVARSVPSSRRNEVLSYSHHVAVAKLEPECQQKFLNYAVRFKWSSKKLRQKIHESSVHHLDRQPKVRADMWFRSTHEALKRAERFPHWFQPDDPRFDYASAADIQDFARRARDASVELARIADGVDKYLAARFEAGESFEPRSLTPVYGLWNEQEEKKKTVRNFTAAPTVWRDENGETVDYDDAFSGAAE